MCSSVGGAAGITESACGSRFRQRGCRKRGMNARSAWTAAGMSAALLRGENRLVPFVAFDFKPFEPPVSAAVLLRSSTEDHIQQQAIVGPEHVGPGPGS